MAARPMASYFRSGLNQTGAKVSLPLGRAACPVGMPWWPREPLNVHWEDQWRQKGTPFPHRLLALVFLCSSFGAMRGIFFTPVLIIVYFRNGIGKDSAQTHGIRLEIRRGAILPCTKRASRASRVARRFLAKAKKYARPFFITS